MPGRKEGNTPGSFQCSETVTWKKESGTTTKRTSICDRVTFHGEKKEESLFILEALYSEVPQLSGKVLDPDFWCSCELQFFCSLERKAERRTTDDTKLE